MIPSSTNTDGIHSLSSPALPFLPPFHDNQQKTNPPCLPTNNQPPTLHLPLDDDEFEVADLKAEAAAKAAAAAVPDKFADEDAEEEVKPGGGGGAKKPVAKPDAKAAYVDETLADPVAAGPYTIPPTF